MKITWKFGHPMNLLPGLPGDHDVHLPTKSPQSHLLLIALLRPLVASPFPTEEEEAISPDRVFELGQKDVIFENIWETGKKG